MRSNFDNSLKLVLVHEGGYANHPRDPGGVTLEGVTQRTYDAYRVRQGKKTQNLTSGMRNDFSWRIERDAIYRQQYWDIVRGDELPVGLDYVVFDGAVNSGASRSAKWLQRALGVRVDGVIGDVTLAAVRKHADHDALIAKILDLRLAFLKSLKTWVTFGRGWSARVNDVLKSGQAMACGSVAPKGAFVAGCNAKAVVDDVKSAPSQAFGDVAASGGAAGGVIAATISQTVDQLNPYAGFDVVSKVIAVLTVASLILTVGGVLYRLYASRKKRELDAVLDLDEVPA